MSLLPDHRLESCHIPIPYRSVLPLDQPPLKLLQALNILLHMPLTLGSTYNTHVLTQT